MSEFGLICGAGLIGGKEIIALELAEGFQTAGRGVHVVTSSWGDRDFTRRLTEAELPFRVLPIGFISATLKLKYLAMTGEQLRRWPELLYRYRAFLRMAEPKKVIHTNWHHVLLLWPLLTPTRDLFWVHEIIPNLRHYRVLFQGLSLRLQCFVAVSNAVSQSLQRIGIPSRKIEIIYNGLSDPTANIAPISTKSNDRIRLGIVGHVGEWKGHDDLLIAFRQIVPQWPTAELHIFGKGAAEYEHHLRTVVADFDIVDRVKWHGFVKDRAAIFSELDICVVPARGDEAFGMVAIEAAGFGLPVIATRQGGLSEIVEDDVTGILVPPNDPAALAEAMLRLLADSSLRRTMGSNARERMLRLFSKQRFIQDFLTLLETHT